MDDIYTGPVKKKNKLLLGKRIFVCGKGGSGKSSVIALINQVLREKNYDIHILDGDASNSGLYKLLGFQQQPAPLVDYFGGVTFTGEPDKVTCPVDDPTPLNKNKMILEKLPKKYYKRQNGVTLFSVGKITKSYEGCHGPQSKVTRDFILPGDHVTLIDIEAGLEHFGRGIEVNADAVLTVVDPNITSFEVARYAVKMSKEIIDNPLKTIDITEKMRLKYVWIILNKVDSDLTERIMREKLQEIGIEPIGTVRYDNQISRLSLSGEPLIATQAINDCERIVDYMEDVFSRKNSG
jgi:CO dehydrogenase maturation factor